MTALREYERLESGGLWRANADAQRRDVVVSFGQATLVISDSAGRPLTHWSLPAIVRQNPNVMPAVFGPSDDEDETLEVDDQAMIDAIEKVLASLAKSRPKPGKLRHLLTVSVIAATVGLAVFWLPGALVRQTMSVVPMPKRTEIGAYILGHIQGLTGPRCRNEAGVTAMDDLHIRLFGPEADGQVIVLPQLASGSVALPGGLILLDRRVIENAEDPAIAAGYIVAAAETRARQDPMGAVLKAVGLRQTMGLLTTGELPAASLADFARDITEAEAAFPSDKALVAAFATAKIPTGPFAYARDASGQRTRALIANDPFAERDEPEILSDADWVRLQGICIN